MQDIACDCGHGSTQHEEAAIGYRCTVCPCPMLCSTGATKWVEVPENVAVGGWQCPCGEFKFENFHSTAAADVTVECPSCGRRTLIRTAPAR